MKNQRKTEMLLLIFGGALLLLHGAHGTVQAIEYFTASAHHFVTASGSSFAASEAAGYRVGAAVGRVFWPLSSLCVGAGLLWLAASKRSLRADASQAV